MLRAIRATGFRRGRVLFTITNFGESHGPAIGFEAKSTGAPIALLIENTDQRSQDEGNILPSFRSVTPTTPAGTKASATSSILIPRAPINAEGHPTRLIMLSPEISLDIA